MRDVMRCGAMMQTDSRASSVLDKVATKTNSKRKASAFSFSAAQHSFALEACDSLNASALPIAAPAPTVASSALSVGAPISGRDDREPARPGGEGPRSDCVPVTVSRGGDGEPAGHGEGGALRGGAPLSGRVERGPAGQAGGGASLDDAPLLTALTVRTVAELRPTAQTTQATRTSVSADRVRGSLSRRSSNTHGQASRGVVAGWLWYRYMAWYGLTRDIWF